MIYEVLEKAHFPSFSASLCRFASAWDRCLKWTILPKSRVALLALHMHIVHDLWSFRCLLSICKERLNRKLDIVNNSVIMARNLPSKCQLPALTSSTCVTSKPNVLNRLLDQEISVRFIYSYPNSKMLPELRKRPCCN